MVTRQDVLDALEKREPFRIYTTDGRMYAIRRQRDIGFMPTHVTLASRTRPRDDVDEDVYEIRYDEMDRLESLVLPAPQAAITPQELLTAMNKEPFVPFRVLTTDGNSYQVRGFGSIAIGKHYVWLTDEFTERGDRIYYDRIVRVEPIAAVKASF